MGNIQLIYAKYYVRHAGKRITSVSLKDFPSPDKAYLHAKRLLRDYCFSEGLLLNEYRYVTTPSDRWLEVKTPTSPFQCDTDHLDIVEDHTWRLQETNGYVVDTHRTAFVRVMMELENRTRVNFLDGDPRNVRRGNVVVEGRRKGQEDGGAGVYRNRSCWVAGPFEPNGPILSFSISKYGVVEARRLAMEAALKLQQRYVPAEGVAATNVANLGE